MNRPAILSLTAAAGAVSLLAVGRATVDMAYPSMPGIIWFWTAHYWLFRARTAVAWFGAVVVVENFVSSLTSSHLFDFMHGWLYVVAIGVAGGMARQGHSRCRHGKIHARSAHGSRR